MHWYQQSQALISSTSNLSGRVKLSQILSWITCQYSRYVWVLIMASMFSRLKLNQLRDHVTEMFTGACFRHAFSSAIRRSYVQLLMQYSYNNNTWLAIYGLRYFCHCAKLDKTWIFRCFRYFRLVSPHLLFKRTIFFTDDVHCGAYFVVLNNKRTLTE